jgi:DNA-binding transcriptional MerR regulator
MKIGEVAEQAGVSIDAVRFYERRGVLPVAERTQSGYRVYEPATIERIRFARGLQHLGFTLDEVIDALHAVDRGGVACASERWRLEVVLERIDARIAALRAGRREVLGVLAACDGGACVFDPERRRTHAAERAPTRTTRSAAPIPAAGAPTARTARGRGRRGAS